MNKVKISYGTSITEARREAELKYRICKANGNVVPDHAKVGYLDDYLVSVVYEDFSTSTGNPMWAYQITHPTGAKTVQHKYSSIQEALEGAENFYNKSILPELKNNQADMKNTTKEFQAQEGFKIAIVGNPGAGLAVLAHLIYSSLEGVKLSNIKHKDLPRTPTFSKEVADFLRANPKIDIIEIPEKPLHERIADASNNVREFDPNHCVDAEQAIKGYKPLYDKKMKEIKTSTGTGC